MPPVNAAKVAKGDEVDGAISKVRPVELKGFEEDLTLEIRRLIIAYIICVSFSVVC